MGGGSLNKTSKRAKWVARRFQAGYTHTHTHTENVPVGLVSVIIMKYLERGRSTIRQTDVRDGGSDTG